MRSLERKPREYKEIAQKPKKVREEKNMAAIDPEEIISGKEVSNTKKGRKISRAPRKTYAEPYPDEKLEAKHPETKPLLDKLKRASVELPLSSAPATPPIPGLKTKEFKPEDPHKTGIFQETYLRKPTEVTYDNGKRTSARVYINNKGDSDDYIFHKDGYTTERAQLHDGRVIYFDEKGQKIKEISPSGNVTPYEERLHPKKQTEEEIIEEVHKMYEQILVETKKKKPELSAAKFSGKETVTEIERIKNDTLKMMEKNKAAREINLENIKELRKWMTGIETPENLEKKRKEEIEKESQTLFETIKSLENELARIKVVPSVNKTPEWEKEKAEIKKQLESKRKERAKVNIELFQLSPDAKKKAIKEIETVITANESEIRKIDEVNRQHQENIKMANSLLAGAEAKSKKERTVELAEGVSKKKPVTLKAPPEQAEKPSTKSLQVEKLTPPEIVVPKFTGKESKAERIEKLKEIIRISKEIIEKETKKLEELEKSIALAEEREEREKGNRN